MVSAAAASVGPTSELVRRRLPQSVRDLRRPAVRCLIDCKASREGGFARRDDCCLVADMQLDDLPTAAFLGVGAAGTGAKALRLTLLRLAYL
jgi:hypothetical protein